MEQFRQIGEVLGSLKALMVFRDEIRINQNQCNLLVDVLHFAFDSVAAEIRENLRFEEKQIKWKALEQPMRELVRIFREAEQYIRNCMETRDWWAKAISLNQNTDCVEFHLHNLLWCVPVVFEAIEAAAEISGWDQEDIQKKRIMFSKKYEKEWLDPKLFQLKFGKHYLASQEIEKKMEAASKEDSWVLTDTVSGKRRSGIMTKHELRLAEILTSPKGKLFPSSILVGSKDYQVRRRLGNGSHYKEIQWMGESFAVRHFFGDIEPLVPEISLISSLSHPNVMHFMCAFSDEERKECFLVMELMSRDLGNFIKEICGPRKKVPFPLPVAVDVMLQIARGMEYLHSRKICHGNLNPSNILVRPRNYNSDGQLQAKITGFGLSAKNFRNSGNQSTATNPCIWCAPEVLVEQEQGGESRDSRYTEKADVYSFAMICFELLTGKVPFEDGHLKGEKMSRNVRLGERPLFPFPSPKYLTNLTKRCWQTDPSHRPSFSSICRILRYIKRFLLLNPNHSQPDPPVPLVDYYELETSLCRRFSAWANPEAAPITQVPFQMFAYRVMEREKTSLNYKDRSSESGSDGASVCGDENSCNAALPDDPLPSPSRSPPRPCSEIYRKSLSSKRLANGKATKQSGPQQKSRTTIKPPQTIARGMSLRMNSESQLQPVVMSPMRRRISGHASDSELA